jgi:hypothetical protein
MAPDVHPALSITELPAGEAGPSARDGLDLDFRSSGNARPFFASGWSVPEEAETWSVGTASVLRLPGSLAAVPSFLVINARPHVQDGVLLSQRLRIAVNGVRVGSFTLTRRTVRACAIPAEALRGRSLEISFETPDAARPSDVCGSNDQRALAVAFSSLRIYPDRLYSNGSFAPGPSAMLGQLSDAMTPQGLMMCFESLGQNCEFGLVQRRCDAEPLGLLRFASTPLPTLLAALEGHFDGMGTAETVQAEISANGREFMIKDKRYGLVYHAWVNAGEMTAEEVARREVRRLPILVRKLREEMELGEKVFVFKGMGAAAEEDVFPLAAWLRRYGPNTLLLVTLADAAHPPGSVERRQAGFFVGYVERFAPGENAYDFLLDQWVAVCRQVLLAHRADAVDPA